MKIIKCPTRHKKVNVLSRKYLDPCIKRKDVEKGDTSLTYKVAGANQETQEMKESELKVAFVDSEGKTCAIDSASDEEISDGIEKLGEVLINRFFIKINLRK